MFSPDRSLSREILFLSTNFLSAQSPVEDGFREVSFLPRLVPNKPCVERASACQARACTGAEGFIHSEESVAWARPNGSSGYSDAVDVYYCRRSYKAVRGRGRRKVEDMRYGIRRAAACVD